MSKIRQIIKSILTKHMLYFEVGSYNLLHSNETTQHGVSREKQTQKEQHCKKRQLGLLREVLLSLFCLHS